jgi:deoxycytidylate deaminase
MEVILNKKLVSGMYPVDGWTNPKRHISALTKGGKVVAYGENNLGGVPNICDSRGKSCHSEMEVLKIISTIDKRKINKYIIWNIRWSKKGTIVSSKPCLDCQKAMLNIGLTHIVYSTQEGTFIKSKIIDLVCKPCVKY